MDENHSEAIVQWPRIQSRGIPTDQFLRSCETVIHSIGSMGTIMNQVKNDMNGNVNKLRKVYNTNPAKYEYLQEMILSEKLVKSSSAPEALLWLKRALHFIYAMLDCILKTLEESDEFSEMRSKYLACYDSILRPYHNWAVQKAFTVCINRGFLPEPRELLIAMAKSQNSSLSGCSDQEIASKIKPFVDGLANNLSAVVTFYHAEGLDTVAAL